MQKIDHLTALMYGRFMRIAVKETEAATVVEFGSMVVVEVVAVKVVVRVVWVTVTFPAVSASVGTSVSST